MSLFLAVVMLLLVAASDLSAAQITPPEYIAQLNPLTIKASTVEVNEKTKYAQITVSVENLPQSGLRSAKFEVDCHGLEIVDYDADVNIRGNYEFSEQASHPDRLSWMWVSNKCLNPNNGTALIIFTVKIPDTATFGDRYEITVTPDDDPGNFIDPMDNGYTAIGENGSINITTPLDSVTLKASTVEISEGTQYAQITVSAEDIPQYGLRSSQFRIDCHGLEIVAYDTADGIGGNNEFGGHTGQPDHLSWMWVSQKCLNPNNGTALVRFTVRLPKTAKLGDRYEITVTPSDDPGNFLDSMDNGLAAVAKSGSVNITAAPVPGNVNGDDKVNARDITAIMRAILGNRPEKYNDAAADVNHDGRVNAKDITAIMRMILG